jgi:hypothetical protein
MILTNQRAKRGWNLNVHSDSRSVNSDIIQTSDPIPVKKCPEKRIYGIKVNHENALTIKEYISPIALAPSTVDLRKKMPAVYDQGNLGSCTANALCAAYQYDNPSMCPSRLFLLLYIIKEEPLVFVASLCVGRY